MSIVYKSNLNFERLEKYLHLLLSANLIEAEESPNGNNRYRITRKGQTFVSRYAELMAILKLPECEILDSNDESDTSAEAYEIWTAEEP